MLCLNCLNCYNLCIVYLVYFGDPALECLVGDIHSHFGVECGLVTVSVVCGFARVECHSDLCVVGSFVGITCCFVILYTDCTYCVKCDKLLASIRFVLYICAILLLSFWSILWPS